MGLGILNAVNKGLEKLGYQIRRAPVFRKTTPQDVPAGARLYVGCGDDRREGFLGCDHRPLVTVDLVCAAWEISHYTNEAGEIYTRHMLEHLTFAEVETTLADWYKALAPGGKVHIIVPNLDAHIEQWLRANWTSDERENPRSDASWAAAGLFGWQVDCDPRKPGYNRSYSDVHKSGYNAAVLRFFLEQAGFRDVETSVEDDVHLHARAVRR